MIYIILGLIALGIICWLLEKIFAVLGFAGKLLWNLIKFIAKVIKWILIIAIPILCIVAIVCCFIYFFIPSLVVLLSVIFIGIVRNKIKKAKIKAYIDSDTPYLTQDLIEDSLNPIIQQFMKKTNVTTQYSGDDIPLGRANAFLQYFKTSIYDENPLFFAPVRSPIDEELREYGVCITDQGIYMSKRVFSKKRNRHENILNSVPFKGIYRVYFKKRKKSTNFFVSYTDGKEIFVRVENTHIDPAIIYDFLQKVIESRIPITYLKKRVLSETEAEELVEKFGVGTIHSNNIYNNRRIVSASANGVERIVRDNEITAIGKRFNCGKNGGTGHGDAAEYANRIIDTLLLKFPVNEAANLDNGHQRKNGADKIIFGQEIQTKYCKTAEATIDALFHNGNYRYIDKNGKAMSAEVPRDQYEECLELAQELIDDGRIPGMTPGESAKKLVRRGHIDYDTSINVTLAGSVSGIMFDFAEGCIISVPGATISSLFTYAMCTWNGYETKKAGAQAMKSFALTAARGGITWLIIGQCTDMRKYGGLPVQHWIGERSSKLAETISTSAVANTKFGDFLNLKDLNSQRLVGTTVDCVFRFGPDIANFMVGKMSVQQLCKNSVITISSMAAGSAAAGAVGGGIIGAAVGMVAGMVAGSVVKTIADTFVEDDAKEMYRILKEEFLDSVMVMYYTQDEFNQICARTLQRDDLPKELRNMYASSDRRAYARNNIMSPAIVEVLSKRTIIETDQYYEAIESYITEEFQEVLN